MTKTKKTVYPSKRTMNLVRKERTMNSPSRVVPAVAIIVIVVALFCKFAVIDVLQKVGNANDEAAQVESQLAALRANNADYDAVLAEYGRYTFGGMSEEEQAMVDRMDMLGLIESELMRPARVESFSALDNVVTVKLAGVTLSGVSDILSSLNSSGLVASVDVYTAGFSDEDSEGTAVSMTITLTADPEGGEAQ